MSTAENILDLVEASPAILVTDPAKLPAWIEAKRAEAATIPLDLATKKGRDIITSLAFRVTKVKTAADAAGKKMNEDARAQINAVDAMRKKVRDALDPLAEELRKPVTDWEAAEAARQSARDAVLAKMAAAVVPFNASSADIEAMIAEIAALSITEDVFGSQHNEATDRRETLLAQLREALARALQDEANRAELARLQREAELRAEAEAKAEQERIAAERAEQAKREEVERQARAAAEQKAREEAAAKQAEQKARAEAEAAAKAEQDKRDREHAAEMARLKKIADDAAAEARAREQAEQKAADDLAKRQSDKAHRSKLMAEAKTAIMEHGGVDEEAAKKIVLAIVAGSVPRVALSF